MLPGVCYPELSILITSRIHLYSVNTRLRLSPGNCSFKDSVGLLVVIEVNAVDKRHDGGPRRGTNGTRERVVFTVFIERCPSTLTFPGALSLKDAALDC